jgi:flagellin
MSLRIATNVQSLAAQRFLNNNNALQDRSLEKLSSGSRINRAGDDAAGLGISENLKASIRSMKQATRNANDGISLIQVAEGSMNEIGNILIRMRELSIQAASDTIGDTERGFVDKEIQHMKLEIDRISHASEYNGTKLLDGSSPVLEVQVGMHNNPDLDRFRFDTKELVTTLDSLGLTGISTKSKENSQENLGMLDQAIVHLSGNRASVGALQNRIISTVTNNQIYTENLMTANSRIRDTDMAEETSELTKANILTQANVSVLSQANQNPQLALKLLG